RFETELLPKAVAAARSIDRRGIIDDLSSQLRDALLFSEGAARKLTQYAGTGPLANWVRTAAMRTALNLLNAPKHESPAALTADDALATADPEIGYLKTK